MSRQVMVLNGTYTPKLDASAHTAERTVVLPDLPGTFAFQQNVYSSLGNFASGGSIGSAMGLDAVGIAQTTSGKVLTIDTPTDSLCRELHVCNTGTAGFWMYGRFIRPGGSHEFVYVPSVGWRRTTSGDQVIAQSAIALTAPADTSENTLMSMTIPGGVLGANGAIIVDESWTVTNNGNSKTIRTKYATTTLSTQTATTSASIGRRSMIVNRNSESSQVGSVGVGLVASTTALPTGTVDTSADFTFSITAQKGTGADSMVLEAYTVTVRRFD